MKWDRQVPSQGHKIEATVLLFVNPIHLIINNPPQGLGAVSLITPLPKITYINTEGLSFSSHRHKIKGRHTSPFPTIPLPIPCTSYVCVCTHRHTHIRIEDTSNHRL